MNTSFLSDHAREIILGSLLGDGSLKIHKGYKNASFSFKHSIKQKEYASWKAQHLKELTSKKNIWYQKNDGFGKDKIRFQSLALPQLTELYKLVSPKGKLRVQRRWLNQLTPRSLAVWWLDDGSLIVNSRRGVLCTDPFSYDEQKILARYLKIIWNVRVTIAKTTRKYDGRTREYYRLWIRSSEELQKLLRIILPYIQIEQMLPKVLLLYRDYQLQQRWISEVATATGFSKEIIEKYVVEKKKKWKAFRE